MTRKKQGPPKRWRSKQARELAKAVEKAGGTIELTSKGHLKVTGPGGVATVASAPDAGHQGGRAVSNTWATVERETGLRITPAVPQKPPSATATPPVRPRQQREGKITRWSPGDPYGFITADDGSSWFVSRDSLSDGLAELPVGVRVNFSGSPTPRPGKPYPEATRVRVIAGGDGVSATP